MLNSHFRALAICGALAGLAAEAHALGNSASNSDAASAAAAGTAAMSTSDRKFVHDAALGGMTEIALSTLAQQKGTTDQVKQFATRMVQDHTKASGQLKQVADSANVPVPEALDKSHQKNVDKLAKLSGADFDKQYASDMLSDHKKTVGDFKKEAKGARDPDLRNFATQTLPTLQEHLDMAKSLSDSAKAEK